MIPSNISNEEYIKYYASLDTVEGILYRFQNLVDELNLLKEESTGLNKYYESSMEQSSFRRDLLENIQELCEDRKTHGRFKETKELAHDILIMIDNSYVEL